MSKTEAKIREMAHDFSMPLGTVVECFMKVVGSCSPKDFSTEEILGLTCLMCKERSAQNAGC